MKKTVRNLCVLFTLAAILLTLAAPVQGVYFSDVRKSVVGADTFDAINYVSDNGIMNGTSPTTFAPTTLLTRGMFVTLLYRYSGSNEVFSNPFTDVPAGRYYTKAVTWAAHYGIVNGVTPTTFQPDATLTREMALTILYRYATSYHHVTPTRNPSITSHADYSNVSNYARNAIRWAKGYDILRPSGETGNLYPKQQINRAEASLYLARFSFYGDLINRNDIFTFLNIPSSFYSAQSYGKHYLDSYCTNRLMDCIDANFAPMQAYMTRSGVLFDIDRPWTGECYGMSLAYMLDKLGKIDFNRNFANVSTMCQVPAPIQNLSVESALNYYQVSGSLFRPRTEYLDAAVAAGMQNMLNHVAAHGPTMLSYWFTYQGVTYAHSVVVLSAANNGNGRYKLTIVDPNCSVDTWIILTINGNNVTVDGDPVTHMYYLAEDEYSFWDNFDLDGEYNDISRVSTAGLNGSMPVPTVEADSCDYAQMTVDCVPFVITNAEGQTLVFDGGKLSGSMKILDSFMLPSGHNAAASMRIQVPVSESFTYTTNALDCSFFVASPAYSGGASGSGVRQLKVDASGNVALSGKKMDYRILSTAPGTMYEDYFAVSGTSDRDVLVHTDAAGVSTEGMSGKHEVKCYTWDCSANASLSVDLSEGSKISAESFIFGNTLFVRDVTSKAKACTPIIEYES